MQSCLFSTGTPPPHSETCRTNNAANNKLLGKAVKPEVKQTIIKKKKIKVIRTISLPKDQWSMDIEMCGQKWSFLTF